MSKYINVIFAKFSLVCIFLTTFWTLNGFSVMWQCFLAAVFQRVKLGDYMRHNILSKLLCFFQHGSDVQCLFHANKNALLHFNWG